MRTNFASNGALCLHPYVAVLVDKNHNGFSPVNPLHKKSCLPKDELIIDPTTLGGSDR